ncbi:MAG: SH3 domain-containing protein, partial [Candidatus Omnitrophica bacterium]|nr:SH3 domain-containing protein [Candidatus Omnitrophota bacterium]
SPQAERLPAGGTSGLREEGEIIGDRVNVRSSAKIESTILGQVEKGSRVRVLEKIPGWYKIAPPAQVFGWVADGLVKFKSRDITAYHPKERHQEGSPAGEPGSEASETSQAPQPATQGAASANSQKVSVTGVLRLLPPRQDNIDVSYELLVRNKSAYFIQGPRAMFDDFARHTVTAEGALNADLEKQFLRPVLNVARVQLVL